jgi:hypothetical protein
MLHIALHASSCQSGSGKLTYKGVTAVTQTATGCHDKSRTDVPNSTRGCCVAEDDQLLFESLYS